jgi:pimeloyl-ACP methyl ester carboxylesterase
VAEQLRAAGHRVLTVTLPGLGDGDDPTRYGLSDTADFLVDVVERADVRAVTLVSHSWGGYPMTAAANRLGSRVKKVIYWSAIVPADGVPLMEEIPASYVELFEGLAATSGNDTIPLPFEVWQQGFMQDATEDAQLLAHALLVPQPRQYFTGSVGPLADWTERSYVLSVDDRSCHRASMPGPASPTDSASRSGRRRAAMRPASPARPNSPRRF